MITSRRSFLTGLAATVALPVGIAIASPSKFANLSTFRVIYWADVDVYCVFFYERGQDASTKNAARWAATASVREVCEYNLDPLTIAERKLGISGVTYDMPSGQKRNEYAVANDYDWERVG